MPSSSEADSAPRPPGSAMPVVVCAVLALLLVGGAWLLGGGDEDGAAGAAANRPATPVATIARRVEALRELRFRTPPRPQRVSADEARRAGLEDLDRTQSPAERREDEETLKLLGLLEPDADLRDISGSIFGGQVAGFYDPRTRKLAIVDSGGAGNRVADETTLAHELAHALEDQVFGLDLDDFEAGDDAAIAYASLVEGSATALMDAYQRRYFKAEESLLGSLSSGFGGSSTAGIPPFVLAGLVFPYLRGQAFVARLLATGSGSWRLVDLAARSRPPSSTEQVMHPEKYLQVEEPDRVAMPRLGEALGAGWKRIDAGTFGEFQLGQWLSRAGGTAYAAAAAGWGGDAYELWRRGGAPGDGCAAPCVRRDVLAMRWRMDAPRDVRELDAAVASALQEGQDAERVGPGRWRLRGATVAWARAGDRDRVLLFAPDDATARRAVRAAARG